MTIGSIRGVSARLPQPFNDLRRIDQIHILGFRLCADPIRRPAGRIGVLVSASWLLLPGSTTKTAKPNTRRQNSCRKD